jgi:hypothetical protein
MRKLDPGRMRLGAVALGLAALLLAVFPLIRPFFPLDPTSPEQTLVVASGAIASARWLVAHSIAMAAFVLLLPGILALYAHLADADREASAFRAMVFSLAGIVLIMPMLGVETHILPIIGRLYLAGRTDIAPIVGLIYLGPALGIFLLGLLLLAVGSICFAAVIRHTRLLPPWAGIIFAAGLTFWFPPFPRMVRVVDGVLIGVGGIWLAHSIWYRSKRATDGPS